MYFMGEVEKRIQEINALLNHITKWSNMLWDEREELYKKQGEKRNDI